MFIIFAYLLTNYKYIMKKFILVVVLVIANVTCSLGIKYYISPTGSYLNNGLSASKPRNDFQSIVNLTSAGDTVFFMDGTYTNSCEQCNVIEIKNSGNKNAYIVLINYPNHHPKIKFNGWQGISIVNGASYIKIIGFEIEGNNKEVRINDALVQPGSCNNKSNFAIDPRFNGNGIGVRSTVNKFSHHLVFSGNSIHECGGGGIGINQCDYITIEDNEVYNNCWYSIYGTSGISIYQSWNLDTSIGYRNFIRRNKCFNNMNLVPVPYFGCKIQDGNGIIFDDSRNTQNNSILGSYKGKTLIENNLVWYNGGSGIHVFLSENIDIINNTAYLNNQTTEINCGQILANSSSNVNIINNILYAPSGKIINSSYNNSSIQYLNNLHYNGSSATLNNSTCINKDPSFIGASKSLQANFHTNTYSPTIDAGSNSLYSQSDIEFTKRPIGKLPDIGAYEGTSISINRSNSSKIEKDNHNFNSNSKIYTRNNTMLFESHEIEDNKKLETFNQLTENPINNILLSPNPAISYVRINFVLVKGQKADLSICNIYGVLLNQVNIIGTGDAQFEVFNTEKLKEGLYFIVLNAKNHIINKSLLISKQY